MPEQFLSDQWIASVGDEINKGPAKERREDPKAMPGYWDGYDAMATGVTGRVALVTKSTSADPDRYAYLEFTAGHVDRAWIGEPEERGEAMFVIGGRLSDWKDVWSQRRTVGQNLMYRKINLFQGDFHAWARNASFYTETINSALRVPTEFPDIGEEAPIGVWIGVTT